LFRSFAGCDWAGRRSGRWRLQEAPKEKPIPSIILAKVGTFWVYEYLFAKQDRANIDDDELVEFRKLVKAYGTLTPKQVHRLLQDHDWTEICNGN
jgi:hypothetical protein